MARQAPPGARANRGAPPRAATVARRAPGYARSSPAATRGLEECPPPPLRRRGGETGPGLQDGSDPFPRRIKAYAPTSGRCCPNAARWGPERLLLGADPRRWLRGPG